MSETQFMLIPNGNRPDFRVIISFLWSDNFNCDSEGNSQNPASREWTELYLANRENKNEYIEISEIDVDPLTFQILSSSPILAAAVTYFLLHETNGAWSKNLEDGFQTSDECLISIIGDRFDLKKGISRSSQSIWRKSTLDNPYPNLKP